MRFPVAGFPSIFLLLASSASWAGHYIGSQRDIPGPDLVKINLSDDGKTIAVGIRSYGNNAFLLSSEGSVLLAARVHAILPDVVCGKDGRTLFATDDSGTVWQFGPNGDDAARETGGAKALAWTTSARAIWDAGLASARFLVRRTPKSLAVRRGTKQWIHDDWRSYGSIEDFQHPRVIEACCLSPSGSYIALQWRSVFTFRREPQERREASTVQLFGARKGDLLWEKAGLGKLLGVTDEGEVLCVRNGPAGQTTGCVVFGVNSEETGKYEVPGHPLAGAGLDRGRFLVRSLLEGKETGVFLDPGSGQGTPISLAGFTNVAKLTDGSLVIGSLSGVIVKLDQSARPKPICNAGGPASVTAMPDGSFLAATTASLARIGPDGKVLWRAPLAEAVRAASPEPVPIPERELLAKVSGEAETEIGLLPGEASRVLGSEVKGGSTFDIALEPGVCRQVVIAWHGELSVQATCPGSESSKWVWPSSGSEGQLGAILFGPRAEKGVARVIVSGAQARRVEVRTFRPGSKNLGKASAPSIDGTAEGIVEDVRLWLFNPRFYVSYQGTRPKDSDTKWLPPAVPARALADGETGQRVMESDRAPWWYEIQFKAPRTTSALLAFEDLRAPASWAQEGFVSGLDPEGEEWTVLARFRGRTSVGRCLVWKPTKVKAIRYHVTRGGNACTEAMLFGTKDSGELEEMEGAEEGGLE